MEMKSVFMLRRNDRDVTASGSKSNMGLGVRQVLKRHPVGLKLDLYGYGMSLWEMCAARLPWSECRFSKSPVSRPSLPCVAHPCTALLGY
jgi:hypothetical protein